MVTASQMHFAAERRIHQTHV